MSRSTESFQRCGSFKHFTLERYRDLYELRERGKVLVRVIFAILPNGESGKIWALSRKHP